MLGKLKKVFIRRVNETKKALIWLFHIDKWGLSIIFWYAFLSVLLFSIIWDKEDKRWKLMEGFKEIWNILSEILS